MYPPMRHINAPTKAKAITQFERKNNIKLPPDYRDFLLATNGGQPMNSAFPIEGGPMEGIGNVKWFLGIGVPLENLERPLELYKGGIPNEVIPIASEDTGDLICLDLRNGGEGVAYWEHKHFWSTGEWREQDLYHVANSFKEFLGLLRPNPY